MSRGNMYFKNINKEMQQVCHMNYMTKYELMIVQQNWNKSKG